MNVDTELDTWRREWQAVAAVPLDLRTRVERQTRTMKLLLLADILITIVLGGLTTAWAVHSREPDVIVLAVATWIFLAVAWTIALVMNHGKWLPPTLDTTAFLNLSIDRCRARLAAIRFAAALFVCELAFCLTWVYCHSPEPRKPALVWLFFSSLPLDLVWLFTFAFFGFLFWYRRKKRAELAYLVDLSRPC